MVEGSPPSPVPDHGHENNGIQRGPITIFFLMIFQVRQRKEREKKGEKKGRKKRGEIEKEKKGRKKKKR